MAEIRPHPGPQESALASPADVCIFGGAAGCGKTYALLLEPLRHYHVPEFRAVIFRRVSTEITQPGGLKDSSRSLYWPLGGELNESTLKWTFPSGARVELHHLQHEKDRETWDGAQVPLIEFDQLESFTESQFWYLVSRLRDPSGMVRAYLRASANPVPADDATGGWLRTLLAWWINDDTGLPIDERSGVLRWFVRDREGSIVWSDTPESLRAQFPDPDDDPMSLTFIRGRLEDNPAMETADPGYRARLLKLPLFERARLLGGNWNARPAAGAVFDRAWFEIVKASPRQARRVRYWDKASTERGGDFTVGVRMAEADGVYYVEDVVRGQWSAFQRNEVIRQTAKADGTEVDVWVEREPSAGGKESAEITIRDLTGYTVRADPVSGDKITRAGPMAAQAEAGNVKLVESEWNAAWLAEHHAFPESRHDDQVDASAGAFNKLALTGGRGIHITTEVADLDPKRVWVRL